MFKIRDSKPERGNVFYNTTDNGGKSRCIKGYPTDPDCNVLSNCVGYACGRFNEIIGSMDFPYLNCNAENFIERAKESNLEIADHPTLGGIMVFQKGETLNGNDGAGHVFIVEEIINNGFIRTSESAYGGKAFYTNVRNVKNNYDMGVYKFRGCIVNPGVPVKTVSELAEEVIAGVWGNGNERKERLTNAGYDYADVQTEVNRILNAEPAVDLLTLVKETMRGDYGVGAERKKALGKNYSEVQHQVNENYKHGTTAFNSIRLY